MTIAVAESIARYGELDEAYLMVTLVRSHDATRGYGKGTRAAFRWFEDTGDWRDAGRLASACASTSCQISSVWCGRNASGASSSTSRKVNRSTPRHSGRIGRRATSRSWLVMDTMTCGTSCGAMR